MILTSLEDMKLYILAAKRLANDTGETSAFENILARNGYTVADIDAMDDVEIE